MNLVRPETILHKPQSVRQRPGWGFVDRGVCWPRYAIITSGSSATVPGWTRSHCGHPAQRYPMGDV